MEWHVIVDNEWFYTGTFEKCCDCVNRLDAALQEDGDWGHSITMISDEDMYGKED